MINARAFALLQLIMTMISIMKNSLELIKYVMQKRSKNCNLNESNIKGSGLTTNGMVTELNMAAIKSSFSRISTLIKGSI